MTAGGVPARSIAQWNGVAWSSLGTGTDGMVTALTVLADGSLVAGGNFASAGGVLNTRYCALWDGTTWLALETGVDRAVTALLPRNAGDFVAAGTPWLASFERHSVTQPENQNSAEGSPVTFSVRVSGCPDTLSFQWQRRNPVVTDPNLPSAWFDLTDDGTFANTDRSTMSILRPLPSLATGYRCKIGNAGNCTCGPGHSTYIYSDIVNFSVACPADFNADGGVDFGDVEAFFTRWDNGC